MTSLTHPKHALIQCHSTLTPFPPFLLATLFFFSLEALSYGERTPEFESVLEKYLLEYTPKNGPTTWDENGANYPNSSRLEKLGTQAEIEASMLERLNDPLHHKEWPAVLERLERYDNKTKLDWLRKNMELAVSKANMLSLKMMGNIIYDGDKTDVQKFRALVERLPSGDMKDFGLRITRGAEASLYKRGLMKHEELKLIPFNATALDEEKWDAEHGVTPTSMSKSAQSNNSLNPSEPAPATKQQIWPWAFGSAGIVLLFAMMRFWSNKRCQ